MNRSQLVKLIRDRIKLEADSGGDYFDDSYLDEEGWIQFDGTIDLLELADAILEGLNTCRSTSP